jgi:hypothetical protein
MPNGHAPRKWSKFFFDKLLMSLIFVTLILTVFCVAIMFYSPILKE